MADPRADLLALKRDLGVATADELAELHAARAAVDAERKRQWVLIGGQDGGGYLAAPPQCLTPDEWHAKHVAERQAVFADGFADDQLLD